MRPKSFLFVQAPECFRGQYSTASDIWSLGVILYVLLDGHFPFDVNGCSGSTKNPTPSSASPAHGKGAAATAAAVAAADPQQQQQQQQQANMFSGRAIRRLLRQGVQFFSGVKARHPVATDLIERMLTFDARSRMQTGEQKAFCCPLDNLAFVVQRMEPLPSFLFIVLYSISFIAFVAAYDALHHPWLLPVPSPMPRHQQQQQQQQHGRQQLRQRGTLLPLQQHGGGASVKSESVAAPAAPGAWGPSEHPAAAAAAAAAPPPAKQQQDREELLLRRQEASSWISLPSVASLPLPRLAQSVGPPATPLGKQHRQQQRQQQQQQQQQQQ